MSVDIKVLKAHGVSAGNYKRIFSQDAAAFPRPIKRLVDMISSRIKDGRTLNLSQWRSYCAIDTAYDLPFNQTTPTILRHILSRHLSAEETVKELANWGLKEEELFINVPGGKALNAPLFFQIGVPLVKAYVGIRTAHLFNQLNTEPLLEYKPLKETDRNRVVCEVVTDLTDTQTTWYGYPATLRQAIQHMLKYSEMLAFPLEEWHCERQLQTQYNDAGMLVEKPVIQKEGLRYMIPHPTRRFYDLHHPLNSINTDSGLEWAAHWRVLSYGDILDNPQYWNRQHIFSGTNWFQSPMAGNYFTEIFPCRINFPIPQFYSDCSKLREDTASWYNSGERDQSLFLTEFFWKIIPKQWGLADYKYPVWHRFTVAGDDTIVWAAPCAYTPSWFMGYDYDENASRNSSMALEVIPWQDHVGNILSQMILTAKQNLGRVVFYDNQIVDKKEIDSLKNLGETRYRSTQYIGFDSVKTRMAGLNQVNAFQIPNFGQTANVTELLQVLPTVLSVMERVLQISAQESGAQATHQQSKEEVVRTGGASTNRVTFIMSSVHEGIDAWKRQLYEGNINYRDANVAAEVSADIPDLHKILEDLGFTLKHMGQDKALVHGQKGNLKLEGFARTSTPIDKTPDASIAQTIFSLVQTIAGQPEIVQKVGAKNLISMLELAAQFGGAPRGFKLKLAQEGDKGEQVPPNIIQAIQAAQQATMQAVEQKLGQPVAQEIGQEKQQIAALQEEVKKLLKIYEVAAATQEKTAIAAKEAESKRQIDAQDAAHKEALRQHEFQAEQARKDAELAADIERKRIESEAAIANKKKQAAAVKSGSKA